ncbi:MAG: V-type ATP synthase subunit K [Candidatus Bipolaricaulia bacterium]
MKRIVVVLLPVLVTAVVFTVGWAQQEGEEEEVGIAAGMRAFAAGLAFFGSAIATGWAQSRIGAAMAGTIAEDPRQVGTAIILVAIPETVVILGFVTALMIR